MKNRIPKDLGRWLKDNGKYAEFIRLINLCGYRCEDLVYKDCDGDYGIKKWLTCNNETKFVDFMKNNPINKTDFIEAIKLAPTIKQNYYTVLSEKDSFDKAINFIETDSILKQIIK